MKTLAIHEADGQDVTMQNEVAYSLTTGGGTVWCIGNGQVHDAMQIEEQICKTLNCMVDPMKILIVNYE